MNNIDKILRWLDKDYYTTIVTEKQLKTIIARSGIDESDCYNTLDQKIQEPIKYTPNHYFEIDYSYNTTVYKYDSILKKTVGEQVLEHHLKTSKRYLKTLDRAILAYKMPKIQEYSYTIYCRSVFGKSNTSVYMKLDTFHISLYLDFEDLVKSNINKRKVYTGIKNIYECTKDVSKIKTPFNQYRDLIRSEEFIKMLNDLKLKLI